eukprot:CAMPEP_0177668074 /NCGR_PEP_ID=MMETSP0447-20121125/22520_1 /TAXON_ID=0 /ORGANISM="Stygamoeba regulata, Strain BSH-02190019" /LENGTH=193 /DNA_ID=CAMNT_0019174463 /DNA_START=233 /DNA_END=814 /DNA_ORIENTATION=+
MRVCGTVAVRRGIRLPHGIAYAQVAVHTPRRGTEAHLHARRHQGGAGDGHHRAVVGVQHRLKLFGSEVHEPRDEATDAQAVCNDEHLGHFVAMYCAHHRVQKGGGAVVAVRRAFATVKAVVKPAMCFAHLALRFPVFSIAELQLAEARVFVHAESTALLLCEPRALQDAQARVPRAPVRRHKHQAFLQVVAAN